MIDGPSMLIVAGLLLLVLLLVTQALKRGWFSIQPTIRGARGRLERGLGLGFRDRRLLQRLARANAIEDRASLLLGEGCFEEAVRRFEPSEDELARIESVRQRIHCGGPI
jgi:hypothetical protein